MANVVFFREFFLAKRAKDAKLAKDGGLSFFLAKQPSSKDLCFIVYRKPGRPLDLLPAILRPGRVAG